MKNKAKRYIKKSVIKYINQEIKHMISQRKENQSLNQLIN